MSEPTTAEKLRALPWDIGFNAANAVFVQFTFFGSVFVLFLNQLNFSKSAIGSILSLIPFTGILALFIAPAVARHGYKRSFLLSWGARNGAVLLALLTPLVQAHFGPRMLLYYVAGVVTLFSIFRAVGMTARLPWIQEFVPDTVRGKYSAVANIFSQICGFLAVIAAGYIIERSTGLNGFLFLFAAGVLFGAISIWAASSVPGGAGRQPSPDEVSFRQDLLEAARDRNYLFYLVATGLVTLAAGPLVSFLPLFMQEEVGLSAGNVVWLQNGTLLGGLLSSYAWGWLADRYGSRPVLMWGVFFQALLPLGWLLMPRQSALSLYAALVIALMQGLATVGWQIGSTRLRFVSLVPSEKKRDYMALYYAWIGIVGGSGQLIAGRLLDLSAGISIRLFGLSLGSYAVLYVPAFILPLIGALLLWRVRVDSRVGVGQFAAMFFRGNPFMAMESLIRYHRARSERAAVSMTERLGMTQSPLTVDELLEALADPRFFVRFEAVVAIGRRPPDERLMHALFEVLAGEEPALCTVAAWALGRIGDERALDALRAGLASDYRSVQAHCARSLGTLGDAGVAPELLGRLEQETDTGLRIAYASALGKLGTAQAAAPIFALLKDMDQADSRQEVALALARLVGDEHNYIQLFRHSQEDLGTTASQALTSLKNALADSALLEGDVAQTLDQSAEAFARQQLTLGVGLLIKTVDCLPLDQLDAASALILRECTRGLEDGGIQRMEYILLTLHTLSVGMVTPQSPALMRAFR
jgi:HEAT repeat protein